MTFLSPYWLFLLLLIPAVVVLHLFRRHRRSEIVPSLLIWERLARRTPRTFDLRVLRDLNLLLQILAIVAAALLLADPVARSRAVTTARDVVVIVDTSASMRTAEAGVHRIDTARDSAQSLVDGVPAGARIAVISAGAVPTLATGYTDDRETVANALRGLEARPVAGDMAAALSMAAGLTSEESEIHLFTDGAFEDPGATLRAPLVVHRTGGPAGNVGIARFSAREAGDGWEVLVGVVNASEAPVSAGLDIVAGDEVIESVQLSLSPGSTEYHVSSISGVEEIELTATLRDVPVAANSLAADDVAYAVVDPTPSARVLLVSQQSYFLETMLSVMSGVEVERSDTYPTPGYFDVVVFDGVSPPPLLAGNYLLFGVRPPDLPTALGEPVDVTSRLSWDIDHPVFARAELSGVDVRRARPLQSAESVRVIARSGEIPLAYTYERGGLRMLGFTFALTETDLPLRVAFPLMIRNALSWLLPEANVAGVRQVDAGRPYAVSLPVGDPVVVVSPSGQITRDTVERNPFEIADTDEVGVYEVRSSAVQKRFAASLLSSVESDVSPRFTSVPQSEPQVQEASVAGRPVWRILLVLFMLCMAADWYVWVRRS